MSLFTQKELAKYSLTKALGEIANQSTPGIHGNATGLEREIHDTLAARLTDLTGAGPTGFLLPIACLKALNVTSATASGFLVGTDLAAIVPALRSKSVVIAMGATVFDNLHGNLVLPVETTTSTAQWLAEMEALSGSDSAYAQTILSPRRCTSMATLSQQLLAQNSIGVENFVRDSLLRTVGSAIDKGALSGNGTSEPLGILNNPNTNQVVTFGGTATRAKAIAFQDALTTANVGNTPDASIGYVTSPVVASKWMQIAEVATFPKWLWDGNEWEGTVAGLPARSTSNVTNDRVILGDWTKLAVAIFGEGVEILADPFSQKKSALVEFLATALVNTGPVNALNFACSTDTGAA
jgi:predicted phage gp36 major capsid-like protein